MAKFETESFIVEYDDSDATKQAVFDRVIEFYKKHEAFAGEVICQSDNPLVEAPYALADIADDILQFNVIDKE